MGYTKIVLRRESVALSSDIVALQVSQCLFWQYPKGMPVPVSDVPFLIQLPIHSLKTAVVDFVSVWIPDKAPEFRLQLDQACLLQQFGW